MNGPAIRGASELNRTIVVPELGLKEVTTWRIEAAQVLLNSRVVAGQGAQDVVQYTAFRDSWNEQRRIQKQVSGAGPFRDSCPIGNTSKERDEERPVNHLYCSL